MLLSSSSVLGKIDPVSAWLQSLPTLELCTAFILHLYYIWFCIIFGFALVLYLVAVHLHIPDPMDILEEGRTKIVRVRQGI